jgi:hypothetical protein
MKLFLFLSVVWFLGLCITIVHEFAHIVVLGGKLKNLQIGIAHKFAIQIKFRNITFYPLIPFAGISHLTVNFPISRFRLVAFAMAGSLIGLLIAILFVGFGLWLLPAEAFAEICHTWRLGFLMKAVLRNSVGIRANIGTAFIASGIMYGIQQVGNLLPVKGYDGYQAVKILQNRR